MDESVNHRTHLYKILMLTVCLINLLKQVKYSPTSQWILTTILPSHGENIIKPPRKQAFPLNTWKTARWKSFGFNSFIFEHVWGMGDALSRLAEADGGWRRLLLLHRTQVYQCHLVDVKLWTWLPLQLRSHTRCAAHTSASCCYNNTTVRIVLGEFFAASAENRS